MIAASIEIIATTDGRRRQWVAVWRPHAAKEGERPECALYGSRKSLMDDLPRLLAAVRIPDSEVPPFDYTLPADESITIEAPTRRSTDR